jgi:hypothetical protein
MSTVHVEEQWRHGAEEEGEGEGDISFFFCTMSPLFFNA